MWWCKVVWISCMNIPKRVKKKKVCAAPTRFWSVANIPKWLSYWQRLLTPNLVTENVTLPKPSHWLVNALNTPYAHRAQRPNRYTPRLTLSLHSLNIETWCLCRARHIVCECTIREVHPQFLLKMFLNNTIYHVGAVWLHVSKMLHEVVLLRGDMMSKS